MLFPPIVFTFGDRFRRSCTSRAAINRVLDPENTSVTLTTLSKVAKSLGRKLKIELVPG